MKTRTFTSLITCALAVALCLCAVPSAKADFIVSGNLGGTVGGQPLSATLSGNLDPTTWSGSESLTFADLPSELQDDLALTIIVTIWKCTVRVPAAACSIFDASGGDYTVARDWTFDGASSPALSVSATMLTVGDNLSFDETVNGTFPVTGAVTSYNAAITPNGPGSALESVAVTFASGDTATDTGVYTWSGPGLTLPGAASVSWSDETFSGDTFSDTFTTTSGCVPEPSTLVLVGAGLVLRFAYDLRQRRRRALSSQRG